MPWQRARRRGKRYFTDPKVAEFYERVRTAWLIEGRPRLDDAPITFRGVFVFGRKPSHLRKDGSLRQGALRFPLADLDNAIKGPLDALQDSSAGRFLFANDLQVVSISAGKRFAEAGEEAHCELAFSDELPTPDV